MNLQTNEKALAGPIAKAFESNQSITFGGKGKSFDVSDYAEKQQDLQADLLAIINPEPKVKRLHRCNGCGHCFAAEKFSIFFNVCRKCLHDAKGKSKLGQSNFIERALNNFRKNLKGALQNV